MGSPFSFFFFYIGNIFLLFDSRSQGLLFEVNEWKVTEGCSWTQAFLVISRSLYLQAKQLLPLCVWMSTHTYARCFPTWQRFQILLFPLNAKPASRLPRIHSRTVTPTHSAANSTVALSHMNVHRGEVEAVALWYQHLFSSGERSV